MSVGGIKCRWAGLRAAVGGGGCEGLCVWGGGGGGGVSEIHGVNVATWTGITDLY